MIARRDAPCQEAGTLGIGFKIGQLMNLPDLTWHKLKRLAADLVWPWRYDAFLLYYLNKLIKKEKIPALFSKIHEIRESIHKDTIFILGSGYSINDITASQWQKMQAQGDTFSFNHFYRGDFVDINYHIIREMGYGSLSYFNNFKNILTYIKAIKNHPKFSKSIYFLLFDKKSPATDWVLLLNLLPEGRIALYSNHDDRKRCFPPSASNVNIPHCGATLFDAINLSYVMGYQKIVLAGVDLYDRRYFWLKKDENRPLEKLRGKTCNDVHATAPFVLNIIGEWRYFLESQRVELYNLNRKSLLNEYLPLFFL